MRLCLTLLLTEQQGPATASMYSNDFITHCSFCWRQKQKARHEQKDVMRPQNEIHNRNPNISLYDHGDIDSIARP